MKDPKQAARELRQIYDIKFRLQIHANGDYEYACTPGIVSHIKETCLEAADVIDNLRADRDSLQELLNAYSGK